MIRFFFILLASVIALIQILASLSVYVNPADFVWPAFFGLGFPFILLANLAMIVVLLFSSKKILVLIPLATLALTWGNVVSTVNISIPSHSEGELKLMTWNVKNFDLYDWSKNPETKSSMFQIIEESNPDILCLQEFYTDFKKHNNLEQLLNKMGYKYYHFEPTFQLDKNRRKWGLITFSRFPIAGKGLIKFEEGSKLNACIYTDLIMENDTVRVYNLHFQSIQFDEDDYEYLEQVSQNPYPNIASKRIASKIKTGFEKRSVQAVKVAENKNEYQGKTIVCGDFNDSSVSFAYNQLAENMVDAFSKKGFGFGKTFVNPTPFLKIDHVLLHNSYKVNSHKIIQKPYSDHYPVIVTFYPQ